MAAAGFHLPPVAPGREPITIIAEICRSYSASMPPAVGLPAPVKVLPESVCVLVRTNLECEYLMRIVIGDEHAGVPRLS